MFQNICLSPLALEELVIKRDYLAQIWSDLNTERLLSDNSKNILKEYISLIDELSGIDKVMAEALLSCLNDKIVTCDVVVPIREKKDYCEFQSEMKILSKDFWKILISHSHTKKNNDSEIELLKICDYRNPPSTSRLRSRVKIQKQAGEEFNFRVWIMCYLHDAECIEIADPYLCSKDSLSDFEYILKNINPIIPIKVSCLEEISLGPHYLSSEKMLLPLKNIRAFDYTLKKNGELRDRKIITDKFLINIGHALGSTRLTFNKWLCRKEFLITVDII